ncbi:DNA phosphorothioation-dependent restriction protein DptH [Sporosarcina pasteurii]|nr:DNA phosphorothioation-dependent restriction protein DptH [Sporosarcina pasteurii]
MEMLNMSNQFYEYIAEQLVVFFKKQSSNQKIGRYYLQLPSIETSEILYEALKIEEASSAFFYQHEKGNERYETIALTYQGYKFVIAIVNESITSSFLVTLRNAMSLQQGEWKNASLILLTSNLQDSIKDGSINLTHEGMPLHVEQFIGSLEKMIELQVKNPMSRRIIKHFLESREREYALENTTFLDFEEVLNIANKEEITTEDYRELHYFPDDELRQLLSEQETLPVKSRAWNQKEKEIQHRLNKNTELHHDIEQTREQGSAREELEARFGAGRRDLEPKSNPDKDKWYETDLTKILNWEEDIKNTTKIELINDDIKCVNKHIELWKRPNATTAAGLRTWHLIAFVSPEEEAQEIEVRIPFSQRLKKEHILSRAQSYTNTSGKNLVITAKVEEGADFYRSVYRHEGKTPYTFNLLVLKSTSEPFESIRHHYKIQTGQRANYAIELQIDHQHFQLGTGTEREVAIKENEQVIVSDLDETLKLEIEPSASTDDHSVKCFIQTPSFTVPIVVKDEALRILPKTAHQIWVEKFEKQQSIELIEDDSKAIIQDYLYTTHLNERKYFKLEERWAKKKWAYGKYEDSNLEAITLAIPDSVKEAYHAYLEAVEEQGTIHSFTFYDEALREKAEMYVEAFLTEIENIEVDSILQDEVRNLMKLGRIDINDELIFTSYAPLNVAYQLELQKTINGEDIDRNTIERMQNSHFAPLIVEEGITYKPVVHDRMSEWTIYRPSDEVNVGESNLYLAQLVQEKIEQFYEYYPYLFTISGNTPLRISIVNIPDDREIVKGLLNMYLKEVKKGKELHALRPIEISAYTRGYHVSHFEIFQQMENYEEVEHYFQGLSFNNKYDIPRDVFYQLQRLIRYSVHSIEDQIKYAHLSFYKMDGKSEVVQQKTQDLPDSLALNGLLTSPTSQLTEEGGYRIGFGTGGHRVNKENLLEKSILKWNEYVANMMTNGLNPYNKDIALSTRVHALNEQLLEDLYKQTNWVTFINPEVDLLYFTERRDDLIIVHYSDQLSSSHAYDAITVTNKSTQYVQVIKQFLESREIKTTQKEIEETIKAFNVFNGEWLLRAIQNKSHDQREKMSVLSAVKLSLKYFKEKAPEVTWIPISMEEIVRVSNAIQLNKKDGLFSGKTIGRSGNCSDDLLMMGFKVDEQDQLILYLYPIEVKIGHNQSGVIDKGISQVKELNHRLKEVLNESTFDAKFMRHFFAQRMITVAQKMEQQQFWIDQVWITEQISHRLLNGDFTVAINGLPSFGEGAIFSFKKEEVSENSSRIDNVLVLAYPEQMGYEWLAKSMDEVMKFDMKIELEVENTKKREEYSPEQPVKESFEQAKPSVMNEQDIDKREEDVKTQQVKEKTATTQPLVEKGKDNFSRPLIGYTQYDLARHWEFGHKELPNRHLLIGGRSGQGKTYFIQSLLMGLSSANQPSLVIDYSSSYTKTQLEEDFVAHLGDRLVEHSVYRDKIPINPFARRTRIVSGKEELEPIVETAGRVMEVFASVYRLGPQQEMVLYRAIKSGIENHGSQMTMSLLEEELYSLEGASKSVVGSLLSRLIQFIHLDPFNYSTEHKWDDYFQDDGQVTIVQLDGYSQIEIKKILTEFILWDLWYFRLSKTEENPMAIVLDEAQNLAFGEGTPANLILREGRKFGWSAWFATQTFTNFSSEELSTLQGAATKVFFNPAESEVSSISRNLGGDYQEALRKLVKGQCLITGQFMEEDGTLSQSQVYVVSVPPMNQRN